MGHLLYRIVERDRPVSGLIISAIVLYMHENDAGPGFYRLAQQYGDLPARASAVQKLEFWADQVARVHAYYR